MVKDTSSRDLDPESDDVTVAAHAGNDGPSTTGLPSTGPESGGPSTDVDVARGIRKVHTRFLLGKIALVAAASVVFFVVRSSFELGDQVVPLAFTAVETILALIALFRLEGKRAETLRHAIARERETAAELGGAGLSLGETLMFVQRRREELTSAFLETSSGWANVLIMIGMVGTAGYLVSHASHFVIAQDANLSLSLARLLTLAPKAFAATGLALFGAVIVQTCAAAITQRVEEQALAPLILSAAWSGKRDETPSADQLALIKAVGSVIDERIVKRLELLPDRLDRLAKSSERAVGAMYANVSQLADRVERLGGQLEDVSNKMMRSSDHVESVLSAFASLSKQSQAVIDQLGKTQDSVSQSVAEALERMQMVLAKYQEQLFAEVSRTAPDFVGRALSGATEEFTQKIREHGNQIDLTIKAIAHQSFGEATRRFAEAVAPTSQAVQQLGAQLERVDAVLERLGGLLSVAAQQWDPNIQVAQAALNKLSDSFERLGSASGPAPGAVQSLCEALEQSSQALAEQAQAIMQQAHALGQIERIVGTGDGKRS